MNPNALLALISDLYAQLIAAQDRIAELEDALPGSSNSDSGSREPDRAAPAEPPPAAGS